MKRLRSLQMQLKRLVDLDPSIDVRYPLDMAHRFGLAKSMLVIVAPLFYADAVHFVLQMKTPPGLCIREVSHGHPTTFCSISVAGQ
jgi:hypothetical protein